MDERSGASNVANRPGDRGPAFGGGVKGCYDGEPLVAQGSRSTFGKYTLLRKLASGGMGEVFLAKQRGPSGFEKLLVIKRILSHHLDKRDYLDMFFSEAKLVARLNHNNIIQIQEMGEIDGDYYIAMEYVRGKSLRDIIDELRAEGRMLPLPHVVDLAIKLCEGLGYAHQARDIRGRPMNIVHRDINPHNVLISYNGDLKLIDFGIAKSEMTSVHTATGTIKGKFVYMSPEQSAADPIDRRSDIFSLGIVLYEMTVLENPFVRQNVVLSLEAIQRHAIPPPSSKRSDAGPMDEILARALEKRPEDRYQTAIEMRDDLRNLLRNSEVATAEEDVSIFLHDLFLADIAEEDRLLAEADRATSGLAPIPRAASATDPPKSGFPEGALDPASAGLTEDHSSDEESADPAVVRGFGDEEPTLAGNLEGIAQKSRDASGGRAVLNGANSTNGVNGVNGASGASGSSIPGQIPEPTGQMMTLIPPDEVVPGTQDELLPELPTRSDRIPGGSRGNGSRPSPLGAGPAPAPPMPLGMMPSAIARLETSTGSQLPPFGPIGQHGPSNGVALQATREMQQAEPSNAYMVGPPVSSPPDSVLSGLRRASLTQLDAETGAPLTPHWRRLGLWVAGVLVFAATAVAGFVATRAVTRNTAITRAPLLEPSARVDRGAPARTTEKRIQSATASATEAQASAPMRAPDPALPMRESEHTLPGAVPEAAHNERAVEEPAKPDREEQRRRATAREQRKQRLEEDRAARAEKKKRADEERKRKLDEERERALRAKEEKKRKAEERQHTAEQAAAKAAQKHAVEEETKAAAGAKRHVIVPDPAGAGGALPEGERPSPKGATREHAPRRPATEARAGGSRSERTPAKSKEEPAAAGLKAARADRPAPVEGTARAGTLTLSTSVELDVEVDGKPTGTTPAVIPVRKSAGKVKLFGHGLDYAVTIHYKVEEGGISVKLDANPWAIAKHNGLSLGKTPQSVRPEARHRFSLNRPGQEAPLVVSLLWNAKND